MTYPGPPAAVPPPGYGYEGHPPAGGYPGHPPAYGYPGYPPGAWGPPPLPPRVVPVPGGPPLLAATPGQRALARLIDSAGYLVVLAAAAVGFFAVVVHTADSSGGEDPNPGLIILTVYGIPFLAWLVIVAYEATMIGLLGATLGMRAMGVRFVRVRDGGVPGFARGLGRAAMLGGSLFVGGGVVFLLLLLSMYFDSSNGRHQGWLDTLFDLQAVSTRG